MDSLSTSSKARAGVLCASCGSASRGSQASESLRGLLLRAVLPSVLPAAHLQEAPGGVHRFEPVYRRDRSRPGQCYLPDKEFRLSCYFTPVIESCVNWRALPPSLHVAMQIGLY